MTTAVERAGEDARAPALLAAGRTRCSCRAARGAIATPVASSPSASARTRAHGDRRARRAAAHPVHSCVPCHRERRSRRRRRRGWRSEVPRPARPHHSAPRRSTPCRPRTSCPTRRSVPADEIIPAPERAAGFMSAPLHVLGVRDGAAVVARRVGGRERARNGRAVVAVQRGRGVESRRVATRPGRAGVPRAPVGQEPDARGAVHEVALLAVERRPGRRVRAVLHRGRRPRRCARRAPRRIRWRRSSRTTCSPISRRAQLHRAPAARIGAERIADLTGIDVAACDVVDLYSCFPSAVRIQARELGLPLDDRRSTAQRRRRHDLRRRPAQQRHLPGPRPHGGDAARCAGNDRACSPSSAASSPSTARPCGPPRRPRAGFAFADI